MTFYYKATDAEGYKFYESEFEYPLYQEKTNQDLILTALEHLGQNYDIKKNRINWHRIAIYEDDIFVCTGICHKDKFSIHSIYDSNKDVVHFKK